MRADAKTAVRRALWRRVSLSPEISAAFQMDSANEGPNPKRLHQLDPTYADLAVMAKEVGAADEQPEEDPRPGGASDLADELGGPGI